MNNNLPSYVLDYLSYMENIKGKSYNTVHCFSYDLYEFFNYIQNDIIKSNLEIKLIPIDIIQALTLEDFFKYFIFLRHLNSIKNSTMVRKITCIKSFFKYLFQKAKLISVNIADDIDYPSKPKLLPKHMTLEESQKLLDAVSGRNAIRDYAIITLFLNCGLRLSELINIQISNIKDGSLRVVGKGDKERYIPLNSSCLESIYSYLEIRNKIKTKSPILFLTVRKTKLSPDAVQLLLKKHIKQAALTTSISPHALRHTSATLLYHFADIDILILKKFLGHESINTTQVYTHVENKDIRNLMNKHPLNKIKKNN